MAGAGGIRARPVHAGQRGVRGRRRHPVLPVMVISGRHLSFVNDASGRPDNAMAVTAQLVSSTGMIPRSVRAYVDVGIAPGALRHHHRGRHRPPAGPLRDPERSGRQPVLRQGEDHRTAAGARLPLPFASLGRHDDRRRVLQHRAKRRDRRRRRGGGAVHLHRLRRRRHEQRAHRPEVRLGSGPGGGDGRERHLADVGSSTTTTTTPPTRSPGRTAPTRIRPSRRPT